MLNQFSRTQLIFGKEAMDVLASSRVAIFGIGGVGVSLTVIIQTVVLPEQIFV